MNKPSKPVPGTPHDAMPEHPVLRILHLDDDPFELERVQKTLERHAIDCHFHVQSVQTLAEYRSALGAEPKPDVALLDIHLDEGGTTGIGLADETRQASPLSVILMCSTADDVNTIAECLSAGADDFISKQTDKGELSLRIFNSYRLAKLKSGDKGPPIGGGQRTKSKKQPIGNTMQRVAKRVPLIVNSAITAVFIKGESGTGKEVVADHFAAQLPAGEPFIKVNCGAIAPTLLESELFGHVKGAFTGATTDKRGLFESASGGWIFLDEVATLSKSAQVALLRVLENHEVRRVGSAKSTKIRVRVLSATNEDLRKMVAADDFRGDLWQRLQETEIELPPLRQRPDEIPSFVEHFCRDMTGGPYQVSGPVMEILKSVSWRQGNIRELRNCLRAMTEMHVDGLLTPLGIPERIWDELGEELGEKKQAVAADSAKRPQTAGPAAAQPDQSLAVTWDDGEMPPFDHLVDKLLVEVAKRLAAERGKLSLRGLAQTIGMSRSTLSGRLKSLVQKGVIDIKELTRYVGVSDK